MKFNKWTIALASAGVVSLGSAVQADEHPVTSALGAVTIGGYVDTSAIWQIGRQAGAGVVNNMPGRSYDGGDKIDGFNLNVVKLSLEKPLDESSWSAGYKVDLLFGPDANVYGTASTPFGSGTADFGIKQAYVALRVPAGNGIDLKMGVFDTIIGYEVFEAGNNPNYSRSYGYFIEPTTHTGLLASYQVSDWMSVAAGIADTWDPRVNGRAQYVGLVPSGRAESEKTYMGSFALTAPESMGFLEGATLYAGVVEGQPSGGTSSDFVNWYAGATMPTPVEGLSLGVAYDYFGQSAKGAVASRYANAVAGYLVWKATEKMTLASRSEYATFSGNIFGAGFGGANPLREVFAETLTLDYKLWDPVITRLELRWDHDLEGGNAFGDLDTNALSLALNVIYKF